MNARRLCQVGILLALITGVAAAAHYHVTRPPCHWGIPCYDYQFGTRSASRVAVSRVALPMPVRAPGPPADEGLQFFQFEPAALEIDHCAVSGMCVQLHRSGRAVVSLRALQNAAVRPDETAVQGEKRAADIKKFTLHLKRNQFFIQVRAYAAFPEEPLVPGPPHAKPLMISFDVDPFWVQRGEPYPLHHECSCNDISRYFSYIDRVELEFYYR